MPRGPRVDFPGAYHHAYGRGIEKRKIYSDNQDRHIFLERLEHNFTKWRVRCLAWALMPNHFHLLLISDSGDLPSFMRCLLTGYSIYYNARHSRVGHLFQNRYVSHVITKESYLREVIKYIHLNPVRSGVIGSLAELEKYPWTGHQVIIGGRDAGLVDLVTIRKIFAGQEESSWISNYRNLVERGYRLHDLGKANNPWNESNTVELSDGNDFRSPLESRPPDKFFLILARVSAERGVLQEKIIGRSRGYAEVKARRQVLQICRSELGSPISHICRWLGITEACGGYLLRSATGSENPARKSS